MDVAGRNVVVTGGASGIGRALARAFAAARASRVVVADLDADAAREVAGELGGLGLGVDVAAAEQVEELVARVEREVGPIDLFCSNAGVFLPGGPELADAEWDRIWRVNVLAHVFAARALVPRMLGRGGGALLHTASAAGLLTQIGSAPYAVTKHAAVAFAEWLAITYGERGLRVFLLCPQAVRTRMTEGIEGGGVAGVDGMLEPEEVAAVALEGIAADRFLILPHESVAEYEQRRAADRERWLRGMQRLQRRFGPTGTGA